MTSANERDSSTTRTRPQSRSPTDELLDEWLAGDSRAGEDLFAHHYKEVARFFSNRINHKLDVEDLTQQTFLACIESLCRFRGQSSFRTFLFAIAHKKLLNYLRQRRRNRVVADPDWRSVASDSPSTLATLIADDEQRTVLEALEHLPAQTRVVLELHYWADMKVGEIAEVTACPPNTVKTRMFRGRKQIARVLTTERYGGQSWAA